ECCTETYCVPGKTKTTWHRTPDECCFDPCTCKSYTKRGHWERCCVKCPDQVCTRQVWKTRTVCEQVPCTTTVKECVVERVPYTVCKKVPYTVVKKVPVTVCKMVPQTIVKKVPYTVCRMETQVCKKQIPYTVTRSCLGAYVDEKGCGH